MLAVAAIFSVSARQLQLPTVIGSGMVLQQNENVNIWGWAKKSAKITVKAQWLDEAVKTKADADGKWMLTLPTPAGSYDRYTMSVSDGKTSIELQDILIGEVWLCSGQSNMAWKVELALDLKDEMRNARTCGAGIRIRQVEFLRKHLRMMFLTQNGRNVHLR